jgi:hypothetical protein
VRGSHFATRLFGRVLLGACLSAMAVTLSSGCSCQSAFGAEIVMWDSGGLDCDHMMKRY